jgi:hypothetical protein
MTISSPPEQHRNASWEPSPNKTRSVTLPAMIKLVLATVGAFFLMSACSASPANTKTSPSTNGEVPVPRAASASATPSAPAVTAPQADYVGRVQQGRASLGITIREGRATAYYCDGREHEAWLRGQALDGRLALDGKLTGSFGGGGVTGVLSLANEQFDVSVPAVQAPAGVFRANTDAGGTRIDGGWLVLPDQTQVGLVVVNGKPASAPPIGADGSVTVNGNRIVPNRVNA